MLEIGHANFKANDWVFIMIPLILVPATHLKTGCQEINLMKPNFKLNPTPWCCIYVAVNWVSTGSDNGFPPLWRQAITWTNVEFLPIGPLGAHLSEIWIKMQNFSFMKMPLKFSSAKWRPFWPGGDKLSSLQWLHYLTSVW